MHLVLAGHSCPNELPESTPLAHPQTLSLWSPAIFLLGCALLNLAMRKDWGAVLLERVEREEVTASLSVAVCQVPQVGAVCDNGCPAGW